MKMSEWMDVMCFDSIGDERLIRVRSQNPAQYSALAVRQQQQLVVTIIIMCRTYFASCEREVQNTNGMHVVVHVNSQIRL